MLKEPRGTEITTIAHEDDYRAALKRLSPEEQGKLTTILIGLITSAPYHNSSILGAKNLSDPTLHALLLKACNGKENEAGMYFGLFLYITFMNLNEEWFVQTGKTGGHDYYQRKSDLKKMYLNVD